MNDLLLDIEVELERMPGKGGWTYALLPDIIQGSKKAFGWKKMDAVIDGYSMPGVSLMPIKGGRLFIAVKAAVRKKIGKEAGDKVHIKLYGAVAGESAVVEDFHSALKDVPEAWIRFSGLPEKEQNAWQQWVLAPAATDDVVQRMVMAIEAIGIGRSLEQVAGK